MVFSYGDIQYLLDICHTLPTNSNDQGSSPSSLAKSSGLWDLLDGRLVSDEQWELFLACANFPSVVITEIVRLALLYHASDQFGTFLFSRSLTVVADHCVVSVNVAFLWSEINLGTGVMCGCLPVYRPLVVKVAALSFTIRESVSSLLRSQRSDSTSKEQNFLSSERPSGYRDLGSSSAKSLKPQTSFAEHPIPLNAIEVKKGYEVV